MKKNTIEKSLEKLDGYLISIKRNIETDVYELEVGFRKDWVFKSTKDIECKVDIESDNGTLVTISGKHDEVIVDDLLAYVEKVIETNKKITEMQENFEKELEKKKKQFEEEILKFQEQIDKYRDMSLDGEDDEKIKPEPKSKPKKTSEIDDEELAQKIS